MAELPNGAATCCASCAHFVRALAVVAYNATVKQGYLVTLPCPARCSPCTGPHTRTKCAGGKACNPCRGWKQGKS